MAHVGTSTPVTFTADPADPADGPCARLAGLFPVVPGADGREDCPRTGGARVHLRLCLGPGCRHAAGSG